MGFAISQLTTQMVMDVKSDLEYQLTLITNSLQQLSMQSQSIVQKQASMGQLYMSQHKDEDGSVDISAIEYVNSSAFTSQFNAQLKQIQCKEQTLNIRKQQTETRQKMYSTQQEGWEKNIDKNISATFKYGQ